MNVRNIIIGIIVLAIIIVGGGLAYLQIAGGSGEVSEDISEAAEQIDAEDTGEGTLLRIDSAQSEARFVLEEDLSGVRTTVTGTTDQVGGDIVFNFANPAESQVGTIRINARNFTTDNNFRNQAIRARILQSAQDEYEFIDFAPTDITGLPESITVGETYTFQIIGDLTIVDTTNQVTFDTEVTVDSETQISGTATANILWADWGLTIPSVPNVANITEDVDLTIDFVAVEPSEDDMSAEATAEMTEDAGE